MKNLILLFGVIMVLTFVSCHKKDVLDGNVVNDAALVENLLMKAKDTVTVNNQKLTLETELYRNFFPGDAYHRNTRLTASVYVVNTDSTTVTNQITGLKLYVINQNDIWISEPENRSNEITTQYQYKLYYLSLNGPKWDTGITVDVVISLTDLSDNTEKYLIARNQRIERIE